MKRMCNAVTNTVTPLRVTHAQPDPTQPSPPSPAQPLCRFSPSTTSSSSVSAGARDEVVSAPRIEDLPNLDDEVPCSIETPKHDHAADIIVTSTCCTQSLAICWGKWYRLRDTKVKCRNCGTSQPERECIRIVQVLR